MGRTRTAQPLSGGGRPRRAAALPRRGAALLSAGMLCAGLAACGSSDSDDAGKANAGGKGEAGSFPLVVQHSEGKAELESAPQRVVALSAMDLDAAISLGVEPVGAAKDPFGKNGISPWLSGKLDADTKLINTTPDMSFEEIAALKPDLILATGDYGIGKNYGKLSRIAPTLAPAKSAAEDSWQSREGQIGKALGKADAARKAVADTEQLIDETAARYPRLKGSTFSASYAYSATQIATIASPDDFAVKFLESLGLEVTPTLKGTEKSATKKQPGMLSPEQADRLTSDMTVIGFTSPQVRDTLEKAPSFTEVKATGVYTPVDNATITELRNPSILGIPWLLEELTPSLKAVE